MNIRNVAIIAHVDHGKTTLVDALLRQTQTKLGKELVGTDLIMDSNELEKERGITIFSKNASVNYKGTKINIVDTPGHADFGGEVERVLKMVDGCLLLIDAKEGPMPQTRFVLKTALKMGHKIIVVINKIDKADARIDYVINKTFDLFLELGAEEETAYFPIVYASGKQGLAGLEPNLEVMTDITPIFEAIMEHIPAPIGEPQKPLQMLVTTISGDNYKGRIATCRIYNGQVKANQDIIRINRDGEKNKYRLTSLMTFEGLGRVDAIEALAGDIVALSGISDITIGETITDSMDTEPLPLLSIEEPTVRMTFSVNTSPFAGKEGEFKTSRQIRERLYKALETDVALRVEDNDSGGWVASGRGELHLAILIERLRREGYEFQVSRPQVIEKTINGKVMTPFERVFIEVPETYSGIVMQKMGFRHGKLQDMNNENGVVYLEFIIATKELFGYRSEFITDTKGLGLINTTFLEFGGDPGVTFNRDTGSLVVHENGITKLYALVGAQDRGALFIGPGLSVYKGQVIGQNSRGGDISVNVCKEKQQTNHRSSGEGVSEHFNTPIAMSLENALEYIDDTELVEVTPKNIRIRKIDLNGTR
ncbi:GTP-binding protein TypA [Candidatus Daviesbacteria bacterium RIFCSPLOWO2_02_FULL_40_8]|nr:MAG: GTP-binding protein TypA [Candidatus Daviesbacteria bacterium RIFCSPHIGHO2_02_FULL_41_14]OGE67086.1 MAG: GTP-binding protein TypA [Candidatus Daviesbacteria bacterium RIFCSPLOWO2_02_FULL_40_8]